MKTLPTRKNLRLTGHDYSDTGAYFVTICVKDRHNLLGTIVVGAAVLSVPPRVELSDIGKVVDAYLSKLSDILHTATLDHFIIMPNHVHLIIVLQKELGTLRTASPTKECPTKAIIPNIVHGMKSVSSRQIGYSIWQRSYHDHIIRNEAEYRHIWQYIDENPARWTEDCYYTI